MFSIRKKIVRVEDRKMQLSILSTEIFEDDRDSLIKPQKSKISRKLGFNLVFTEIWAEQSYMLTLCQKNSPKNMYYFLKFLSLLLRKKIFVYIIVIGITKLCKFQ